MLWSYACCLFNWICPAFSFSIDPTPHPQSGCRRQYLGAGAKTEEALGIPLTLGFKKNPKCWPIEYWN